MGFQVRILHTSSLLNFQVNQPFIFQGVCGFFPHEDRIRSPFDRRCTSDPIAVRTLEARKRDEGIDFVEEMWRLGLSRDGLRALGGVEKTGGFTGLVREP